MLEDYDYSLKACSRIVPSQALRFVYLSLWQLECAYPKARYILQVFDRVGRETILPGSRKTWTGTQGDSSMNYSEDKVGTNIAGS